LKTIKELASASGMDLPLMGGVIFTGEYELEAFRALVIAEIALSNQVAIDEFSRIATTNIDGLKADGFSPYTAVALRKDTQYCIVGSHGDVRWFCPESNELPKTIQASKAVSGDEVLCPVLAKRHDAESEKRACVAACSILPELAPAFEILELARAAAKKLPV
jgi:hypothetical protein